MAAEFSPTPFSNPPRTEEITVAGLSGFTGGVMVGLGSIVLIGGLASGAPLLIVIAGGLVTCVGIALVLRSAAEARSWDPLVLHFPTTQFALGSLSTVNIERRSKKSIPDAAQHRVGMTLKCHEWVRYTVGSNTYTKTNTVVCDPIEVVGSITANTFVGEFELEIPVDSGGPTFELRNNRVSWSLDIELDEISTVSGTEELALVVTAELDHRHKRFVDAPPPPRPRDA